MVTSVGTAGPRRALIVGASVTVACSLPVFFTGAMAVQISTELGFGPVGIGGAVAAFFATMALVSIHLGRVVDRFGATLSMRIAALGGGASALGVALLARNWPSLVGWLVLSGLAAALAQPAANRLLVNRIRQARLGTAFGMKQSAPPIASMLAGLAVPAVALTVGWRWAYVLAAIWAVLAAVAVGPRPAILPTSTPRAEGGKPPPLKDRATLVVMVVGFGLAFITSSAVLAFYVEAAVRVGVTQSVAGAIFAAGSFTAILARLVLGAASDRYAFSPLRMSSLLLVGGTVGLVLLATGRPVLMGIGAVIALTGTWGFPGLFWFALVSAYAEAPGRITGAMAPAAIGGIVGPVGFGALATTVSYTVAWSVSAVIALLAAIALLVGATRLDDAATGAADA